MEETDNFLPIPNSESIFLAGLEVAVCVYDGSWVMLSVYR